MDGEGVAGNPQPCASCKHQRKRCDETCELAPYFPANRYDEYQNAHKLFGLSNIVKIINSVEPNQRQAAAESILQEGNARYNDPVHGCLGIVRHLESQIEFYEKQTAIVNQQLQFFRDREQIQKQKEQWENFRASSSLAVMPPFTSSSFTSSSFQHEFDGYNYQTPNLSDLLNVGDMKIFDHGYNYQSTLDEGADVKTFDIQSIHQMLDANQNGDATYFDGSRDSSIVPKTNGQMPLDVLDNEEEASKTSGKMALDVLDNEEAGKED